jgi:ATP-binding cassette subfamily B protein
MYKTITTYIKWFTGAFKTGKVAKRLIGDVLPQNRLVIFVITTVTISMAGLPILSSFFYSKIIGAISIKPLVGSSILFWFAASIGLTALISGLSVFKGYFERIFFHRVNTRFSLLYFTKKAEIDIGTLEEPTSRDLVTKAQDRGILPMVNIVDNSPEVLAKIFGLASSLIVVLVFDWRLALLICVSLIPQFLVDVYHGKTTWGIWDGEVEERRQMSERQRQFYQRTNLIELRLFQNVSYFLSRIKALLTAFQIKQEKAERVRHILSFCAACISVGTIGFVLYQIIGRIITGEVGVEKLVFIWGSVSGLQGTFSQLLAQISSLNSTALYVSDIYATMDLPKEKDVKPGTIKLADRIPTIEFKNVWFKYPHSESEKWILKDVSFFIKPGEKVALTGINGAGKTTIVRLITGIYEPTQGGILIDGVSTKDLSIESLRKSIAVLFQEYTKYHLTIREIISYGDTSVPVDEARVTEAVRAAGCTFIDDLPKGLNTIIGRDFEGGIELSGGQSQRLALARIWYRRGKVVILDEPTASLDAFAEEEIFQEIERRPNTETIILITHRMSSVRNAEHIIVLDDGQVAEEGNHDVLLKKHGVYATMFEKQARGYEV